MMSSSSAPARAAETAYTLTMEGVKVLMIEAGRTFDPATEVAMFQLPSQAPLRGEKTPDKQYGFHDCSINSGWEIPGEPYTNANKEPESQFKWWRQRMMGGRTNHWGRISLRNGPYDFKPRTRFGAGFDWPISYDDVAPYYDKVEMLVGVYGTNEGLENSPILRRVCYVYLKRNRKETLVIPKSALLLENYTIVWIETPDGMFEQRMIETGISNKREVEILSGLTAGARVVITGGYLLNSAWKVKQGGGAMEGMDM